MDGLVALGRGMVDEMTSTEHDEVTEADSATV